MFDDRVYKRGALTLHTLRRTVGDEPFFDVLRQWVERFGGGNATTADFEALVEDVTGEPHADLFGAWLREPPLPELHR
jgi:aminopeptidase N